LLVHSALSNHRSVTSLQLIGDDNSCSRYLICGTYFFTLIHNQPFIFCGRDKPNFKISQPEPRNVMLQLIEEEMHGDDHHMIRHSLSMVADAVRALNNRRTHHMLLHDFTGSQSQGPCHQSLSGQFLNLGWPLPPILPNQTSSLYNLVASQCADMNVMSHVFPSFRGANLFPVNTHYYLHIGGPCHVFLVDTPLSTHQSITRWYCFFFFFTLLCLIPLIYL
jgi:purine nucleoside phosphorylase